MAATFRLSVVAPDKAVVETTATSLVAPGVEGYFGVQAGHVSLVAALRPGLVEYFHENQRRYVYVGGGFAQVGPTGVTILADEAEDASAIEVSRAEAMLEEARRGLNGEGSLTSEQAVEEIERAVQRLRAARAAR